MKRNSQSQSKPQGESRHAALIRRLAAPQYYVPLVLVIGAWTALAEGRYTVLDARRAEADLAETRARIEDTRRQIDSLAARLHEIRHDDAALERVARERYGLIREDEILYRVP